jgi:hypothetical protein
MEEYFAANSEDAYTFCPPDDQPWLISSAQEIDDDEEERQDFIKKWLLECPYPGNASSKEAKMSWHKKLKAKYEQELEDSCYDTLAPEANGIVREVLLQMAPKSIVVELCVSKTNLESIVEALDNISSEKDQAQFASNLSKYARKGYTGENTWPAYKRWLLEVDQHQHPPQTSQTTQTTQTTTTNLVTFGSMECGSDDELVKKFEEFALALGMDKVVAQGLVATGGWQGYGLHAKVGHNMYCALPDNNNDNDNNNNDSQKPIIGFTVEMLLRSPLQTETERAEYEFRSKLKEMERASLQTFYPQTYLLVQRENDDVDDDDDAEDNLPMTAEHFHVLWLPREYLELRRRIEAHVGWGKGESARIQQRLEKGNTDTGNLKFHILEQELDVIKKNQKRRTLKYKFCSILALTEVAAIDNSWMQDNECPEDVAKLISKDLTAYWKMSLLKQEDQALGLGNEQQQQQQQASSAEELSESRKALHAFLNFLAKQFEDGGCDAKVKFTWQLTHYRLKNSPNAMNKKQKVAA